MSTAEVSREVPGGVLRIVPALPEAMPDVVPEPPAAVEPESAPARAEGPDQPVFDMRDVPLGTLLHRSGLVTAEQLGSALAEGSRTRQRLGEVLVQRGWIDDAHLSRLLAGQKGLPFIELASTPIDLEAYKLWDGEVARERGALAIAFEDGKAVVVISDPTDDGVVAFLDERLAGGYTLAVAARTEIDRVVAAGGVQPVAEPAPPAPVASEPAPEPVAAEPAPEPAPSQPVWTGACACDSDPSRHAANGDASAHGTSADCSAASQARADAGRERAACLLLGADEPRQRREDRALRVERP